MSRNIFFNLLGFSAGSTALFSAGTIAYSFGFNPEPKVEQEEVMVKQVVDRGPVVKIKTANGPWYYTRKFLPSNLIIMCMGNGHESKESCNRFLVTKKMEKNKNYVKLPLHTNSTFQLKSNGKKYRLTYRITLESNVSSYYAECKDNANDLCAVKHLPEGWSSELVSEPQN